MTDLQAEINKAVASFLAELAHEPLVYFSEADCQQRLAEKLREIGGLSGLHDTRVQRGKGARRFYQTPLIHREYGGGEGTRIDIVVLDKDDVGGIDDPNLRRNGRYLTPAFAFELGTEKSSNTAEHICGDVAKLRHLVKPKCAGYVIHIFRDATRARSGTKSRDDKDDVIDKTLRQVVAEQWQALKGSNIHLVAVLLTPFKNQSKSRNTRKIFDGTAWQAWNVNKPVVLQALVADLLKE